MRFSVSHETLYRYAKPVRLGSHVLRLNPRPEGVELLSRELVIEPAPATRYESTDAFGNLLTHVGLNGATDVFRILSRFELELHAPAPLAADLPALPWPPSPDPYLVEPHLDIGVHAFAARLALEAGGSAPAFLDLLNRTLYADIRHDIRDVGAARTPAETLALGHGACRDVTVLFLAACRSLGLPARFVSGYQAHAETPDGRRHLHAWAEAFLPGAGWRGYDPTHGLAVTDGHVALCVAPDQAATMPVEGGYFGDYVASTLSYDVAIEARP
jgi:transglutaminase-like putative cysteine protease